MKSKKYRIQKTQSIGAPDAETDDELLEVFVNLPNVEELVDTSNQKSILIGRTGTGKSAIIKYLKANCQNLVEIEPESMSLRFLSNSTILNYFKSLGVNLILFYKVLWKHVFIVELLKLHFKDDLVHQSGAFTRIIQNIQSKLTRKNPQRKRALEYLRKWSYDFWQETEYRVKSLEKSILESYAGSMGVSIDDIKLGISSSTKQEEKYKIEAKQKAERVIQDSQSKDILEIVSIMKDDLFVDHQKKHFIVIDDLDRGWIEDSFRYELIGAMVEVIKEFRRLSGVKIVIALRENLNEIVFSGLQNRGGQREKFKPLYSNIEWSKDELLALVNKRLKRISEQQLEVSNAFFKARRQHANGFEYMIDRTYMRPRDVISFINHAIENTNNKTSFTKDILSKAEVMYSLERFQALEDEWSENYGQFAHVCSFLNGINNGFTLKSLKDDQFESAYLEEQPAAVFKGELRTAVQDWQTDKINFIGFTKKIMFTLYRIGILGVKKEAVFPTVFVYQKEVLITKSDISNKCRFYVHPALYSYFKVNTIEQLPEVS